MKKSWVGNRRKRFYVEIWGMPLEGKGDVKTL